MKNSMVNHFTIKQTVSYFALLFLSVCLTACGMPTQDEIEYFENQGFTIEELEDMSFEELESTLIVSSQDRLKGRGRRTARTLERDEEEEGGQLEEVKVVKNWLWGLSCEPEQSDWDRCEALMSDLCDFGVVVTAFPSGGMCHARCNCADQNGDPIGGIGTTVDSQPI